jgi:8-oxo-dGTP pyrophosphatase MutT (NUDIX family)
MTESKMEAARMSVLGLLAVADDSTAPSGTTRMFREFAARHVDCCERTCVPGHFTGSSWVVSADGERALLMHHCKLGIWVQPGGHADGDGDLAAVALREAPEETGLTGLRIEGGIFDLDRHLIPPRGNDAAHFHYDVRFVVRAGEDEAFVVNEESHALAWRPIRDIASDSHADGSVQRMARKWLEQKYGK